MFKIVFGNPTLVVLLLILCLIIILINMAKHLYDDTEEPDRNRAEDAGQELPPLKAPPREAVPSLDEAPKGPERTAEDAAPSSDRAPGTAAAAVQTAAREARPLSLRPKITINRETTYRPEQLSRPFQFSGKTPNPQNDSRRYLILEKHAHAKLKDGLDWGRKTRRNCVEQGGILLGRAALYGNEIYCFVKDILLADTSGDPVFVELSSEMWAAMQARLDIINASLDEDRKLAIVGWFHTHPNNLAVFMSGTDMQTQRLNFSQEWQASLVMNPHMDRYRAFFGANAVGGKIVLLGDLR